MLASSESYVSSYCSDTAAGVADDEDRALAALRRRWPDYSIYRAWWGWYAIPKGCELVSALYSESLDEQLRQTSGNPGS